MTTNRTVVGAHYGMRDWLAQRITGVILAVYAVLLIGMVLTRKEMSYGIWAGFFAESWMKVATLLAILALIYHAWVGVRDIYMDYIKPTAVRLTLQVLTILALISYAAWALVILWRV
jgi:succinate dehydrogenase / fumarate reductase, membrane anchor subunit